jgi:hypothetical protein
MVAVGNFCDVDVAAGKESLEFPNMACGNIRVMQPLKD